MRQLPWLEPGDTLPDPASAWGVADPVPGLLAAGGALDVDTLVQAYSHCVFPWFSDDQPILWWSPDPRMVLQVADFKLHRSLRKTLLRFAETPGCEVRIDHDFAAVIKACSLSTRVGQSGTWIVPDMVEAYTQLHAAGRAHSVETWIDGELAGGLYCVALGRAVFGESMFTRRPDASKIALAALVSLCRRAGVQMIDCQQNTAHLASLGAREMPRKRFVAHVAKAREQEGPQWQFEPVYWAELLSARPLSPT
ncbi:leucyl/phenylalanyl-tRNA--protein transferase [Variovorax boronicumulans]|uniref:leucyl/phenylalanyl-tRNA--protein transferase n=1 Tax=Variovorax boronicumulans TaxID=436515 RepID=UPI00278B0789|nr:leucyl/phenylalanyl-tRNA--protein transferase [Variovorax boronicumulans]MDQ0070776.1 leucyl/phenylalanyl-tRNA--protein transferase [Variovorax boronicumulans]